MENEGLESIPWSAGLHPYFQIPWRKDLDLIDHQLSINAKQIFQYKSGEVMQKTSNTKNVCTLDDPELINRIFYELKEPSVCSITLKSRRNH